MRPWLKYSHPIILISLVLGSSILAGCLGNDDDDDNEETGVSALFLWNFAETERSSHTGDFVPVVVTALDPTSLGNSLIWKYAYNDMTSGITFRSLLVTVDQDGTATSELDDPLSKSPIRNWTVDSITAYSKARSKLLEEEIISANVKIKVQFFYLLGEDSDNNGCEWTIGFILGSEYPIEATVRVDGRYGNVIEIIDSKS